jgi:hypothetical protein
MNQMLTLTSIAQDLLVEKKALNDRLSHIQLSLLWKITSTTITS